MARSVNQKLKVFYLRKILLENTDREHFMTMNEIIDALNNMGIKAERKSIYNDIDLLRDMGIDIVNQKRLGYAVVKKDFDLSDVEVLIKALDNYDIMDIRRQEIKDKLKAFLSKYEVNGLLD